MPEDHIEDRLVSQTDRYTDSMARYHYALYTHLRDWFNFKMKLIVMDSYGYATANGSYNGLIGLLHSKEVELGISAVLIRHGRLKFVDYTAPTWLFCNPILFRHPKATAMPDALAQPFSAPVWLCCAACWLLVMVSLRFIVVLESRRQRTASDQTWSTACITIVEVIAEQEVFYPHHCAGAEVSHKWTSWRVLFLFALVQAVILNNYYGASLVSSLVAPSTKTIRTVEDLIKSSLKVGYVNVSYNHDFFKTSSNPLIKKLYSKKVFPSSNSKPNVFSREVAVKKIKEEAFAIQAEAISLYPLIEDQFDESEKCSLAEVNAFPPNTVYSIIQKGSPYKKLFAFGLRALWERGLMKRQLHLWRPSPPQCYGANEVPGVELGAISLALVLLAAGTVTALAILVVECQLSHDRCKTILNYYTFSGGH
ncbi:hypothetical protein ANN_13551 [Periplaneta americana]|uniref:Ionotropic glutamate receptor L-glutamate and glycine-binding domain-containing protein n=1 Tax=Periplaneta americana TaxID=6978 RepID=A0ABQ8TMB1_PERAM|nr:hypothetical protein ANN_13551 [Periplaneta americana]